MKRRTNVFSPAKAGSGIYRSGTYLVLTAMTSGKRSHPTVRVAFCGTKVSDQLSSFSSEELPVRMEILLVYSFLD